jgi:oligoribonuclease NrnB/cAMP/cGMP phosphodiesterase (DHH superfamily)
MNLDNTLLVTHKNCLDGTSCVLLFLQAGGKRENILMVPAGQVEAAIKRHKLLDDPRSLLFCDLGVTSTKTMDSLEKRGNCVYIDHHIPSLQFKDRPWCVVNMDKCGSKLLSEYLGLNNHIWINEYCDLVDDFDRGVRNKLPNSEDLVTFHSFIGSKSYIDKFLLDGFKHRYEQHQPSWLTSSELDILSILNHKQIEAMEESLETVVFRYFELETNKWVKVGYVVSPNTPNYSALLHEMLKRFPEVEVGCVVHSARGTISLASRSEDINVSTLARRFGGGGHARASGHPLPQNLVKDFITNIHDSIEDLELLGK